MQIRAFVVIVSLFSTLALSACGSRDTPIVAITNTVEAPTPSTNVTAPAASTISARQNEARRYLKSSDRLQLFKNNFVPAALRIAKALENGDLGPTTKYDSFGLPLAGEVGWGKIATVKGHEPSGYALVWYDKNSRIDYTKDIRGASINAGVPNTGVQIEVDGIEGPYDVYLQKKEETHTTSLTHAGKAPAKNKDHFLYPSSLVDLIQLDREGIKRLNANIAKVLGPN